MVDLDVLEAYGVSVEKWRAIFEQKPSDRPDKVNALINRIRLRAQAGRDSNFKHHLTYKALDEAWDVGMKQITPTLLQTLQDKSGDEADVTETLRTLGMDPADVLIEVPDPKTPGKNIKKVSAPAFFRVMVPLCCAYVKIRWAKLVNDRKDDPLFKFSPVIDDQISRLKCDALTSRIQVMSRQYGYFEVFKQAVFRMLHYAECLQFPVEEWHTEEQILESDAPFEGEDVKFAGKQFKKCIVKEGMRYHLPHPTRTYYDRACPASTFNTDTGCQFAGYWRILRWRDVIDTAAFYNKDSVGYAEFQEWFERNKSYTYWNNLLRGSTLSFPSATDSDAKTSDYDNEKSLLKYYSQEKGDAAILISEHYEKIIPSDWGLGSYPYPIWARFTLAADNNIIYAAPLPYRPVTWYGYDWAEGRTHVASMTLECLPFQDQFSNLLTQVLLTTRQNLANITFINTDVMEEKHIKELENFGERWWRRINIVRASFKKLFEKQRVDGDREVIKNYKMTFQDTTQLYVAMKTILDTLERVLVMSAQEVGQAATHEQTREEIKHITEQTSIRVTFTGLGVDAARDAWKHQLYDGLMAYGSGQFYAQVPMPEPLTPAQLQQLGFTMKAPYDVKNRVAYVEVKSSALLYEKFADDRDGVDRVDDVETGRQLLSEFSQLFANPMMAQAIGADQAIKIINYINRFLGLPRDFKLVNVQQAQPDQLQQELQQALSQLKQYVDQNRQQLEQDIQGAMKQVATKNDQQDQGLAQMAQDVKQILQLVHSAAGAAPDIQPMPPEAMDTFQQPANSMQILQGVG